MQIQEKILQRNEEILFEEIKEGGMLLYNNLSKETHILNETAALIFNLCEGKNTGIVREEYLDIIRKSCNDTSKSIEYIINDFLEIIDMFLLKKIYFLVEETKN